MPLRRLPLPRVAPRALLAAAAAFLLVSCLDSDPPPLEPEPLAVVTPSPTSLALRVGDTASVTVTTTPALATGRTVSWTSTQPSIATIVETAPLGARVVVRGVAPGTGSLTLTFTTPQQTASATMFVIVRSQPTGP